MQIRNEEGSITLEAALILPMFMMFIVFLASIIRISVAEISLDKAVSETTEIVATHAYPATIFQDGAESFISDKVPGLTGGMFTKDDLEEFAETTIHDVFDIDVSASDFINDLTASILKKNISKRFKENVRASSDPDVEVEVDAPGSINGGEDSYLDVTASYDLDLTVPFVDHTITIKKRAYERLWVGRH